MFNFFKKRYIKEYKFHSRINYELKKEYPHLSDAEVDKILEELKVYFLICLCADLKMTYMPSKAVDVAWHWFILFTREYDAFCRKTFGKFLHHSPAESKEMSSLIVENESIERTWVSACLLEGKDPFATSELPYLFGIDKDLKINDGFKYTANSVRMKYGETHT